MSINLMNVHKEKELLMPKYSKLSNSPIESAEEVLVNVHDYGVNEKEIEMNDKMILGLISEENYTESSILLHELIKQIQSNMSFKDELVKAFRLFVCFYNLGVVYWRIKRYYEAEKYLGQSLSCIQTVLRSCQFKEQHLIFTHELIKVKLQLCVVLSQNGKHQMAIEASDEAINKLFQCFEIKLRMVDEIEEKKQKIRRNSINKVDFRNIVLAHAKQKLQYLNEIKNTYKLMGKSKQQLYQTITKLYTWKKNLQNNEKFIRLTLNIKKEIVEEPRNILGVNKSPQWIQDFNIGIIMTLSPKKLNFKPNLDTYYLLSTNKILQLVTYTTVVLFTISTEMRYNELCAEPKEMTSHEKFLKMSDNPTILKCKIYHLKAIELVGKFMPNSNQYISHLISSFNKNYKFYMDKITEENSCMGQNLSTYSPPKNDLKMKKKRTLDKFEKNRSKIKMKNKKNFDSEEKNPKSKGKNPQQNPQTNKQCMIINKR